MSDVEQPLNGAPGPASVDGDTPGTDGVRSSITESLSKRGRGPRELSPNDGSDGLDSTQRVDGDLIGGPRAKKRQRSRDRSRLDTTQATTTLTEPIPTQMSAGHLGSVAGGAVQISEKPPVKRKPKAPRQTRKARLRISRIDPWSVMKTALLFGVAGWIILIVAVWVIFTVLDMTGLYEAINGTISQVFASPDSTSTFDITKYVNTTRVTALAAFVGAVSVILITALATIFAFLYNLSANVMGGIEVTLAED